jgi:polyhydroxyalkanoate synthesis repressor PhaR
MGKGEHMAETTGDKLLIKRYASRRLYNTETSDYVTLETIAQFVRDGREVQILDLKTGDDLTRQYMLQIIAEHESRGENVLPINVLTDLVRSYAPTATASMVPQFLASSFEMLRESQAKMVENIAHIPAPLAAIPGMDQWRKQQEAFLSTMMGGWKGGATGSAPGQAAEAKPTAEASVKDTEIEEIKRQLAALQKQLGAKS